MTTKMGSSNLSDSERLAARESITSHATVQGVKNGLIASTIAAAGVYTANTYWKAFRTRLGISGKTALIVSPFIYAFTLTAEERTTAGARNPEKYLAAMNTGNFKEDHIVKDPSLKSYQKVANYVYDYPYRTLAMTGIPVVASIFYHQSKNAALQTSQQIMHTRIYGQGAVVALLLTTMAFHDYMDRHGRFVSQEEYEQEN